MCENLGKNIRETVTVTRTKEPRKTREPRKPKEKREPIEPKEPREPREPAEPREPRESNRYLEIRYNGWQVSKIEKYLNIRSIRGEFFQLAVLLIQFNVSG